MGPIAVVCLMLLCPVLGWGEEPPPGTIMTEDGNLYTQEDRKWKKVTPGGASPKKGITHDDCQEIRPDHFWCGGSDNPDSGIYHIKTREMTGPGIVSLAIQTAKMVGFEYVQSSLPKQEGAIYLGPPEVPLTAKCFPYPTDTEAPFPSVSCQVYAGQTGKILNMECRKDLQQCMVTGVLDIHQ